MNSDTYLRDHLAADRTVLANERTLLAYVRTSLTLLVAGATFIKFFNSLILEIVGWIFVPASIISIVLGMRRYFHINHLICDVIKKSQTRVQSDEYK
jgi:putative membrane protein